MDWRALEATVDGAMGAVFGESVRLSPMKGGAQDPSRPMADIRAVFHVGVEAAPERAGGFQTRTTAGDAEVFLNRDTYRGPLMKVGDRVRASDRGGMPWFEVSAVSDRYSNLIVLSLTQV